MPERSLSECVRAFREDLEIRRFRDRANLSTAWRADPGSWRPVQVAGMAVGLRPEEQTALAYHAQAVRVWFAAAAATTEIAIGPVWFVLGPGCARIHTDYLGKSSAAARVVETVLRECDRTLDAEKPAAACNPTSCPGSCPKCREALRATFAPKPRRPARCFDRLDVKAHDRCW